MNTNADVELRWMKNKDRILPIFSLLRISVILLYVYVVLYVIFFPTDEEFEDSRSEW